MGIVQRCEATSRANVVRHCAIWLRVDPAVAMIEKDPAIGTIGFDSAAALVQQRMMGTA